MSHDMEDLLEIIKMLEHRIIDLECKLDKSKLSSCLPDDHWYWNH